MPYNVVKKGSKYFVENKNTGRVMGHHDTKDKAMSQMKALYANIEDAKGSMNPSVHMSGKFNKPEKMA